MQRYAIILAAENYQYYPSTSFCHADAQLLYDTLVHSCDFAEQNVHLQLLQIEDKSSHLQIISRIEQLASNAEPGDTLLFYYAGHGHIFNDEPYLILPNTKPEDIVGTALPLRSISHVLRNKGKINIRIFDACHSGYDVRDPQTSDDRGFIARVINEPSEGWITLAACRADEFSYPIPEFGNGAFTKALCDSIKEFDEHAEILPEMLKVKLCLKMEQFCTKYGISQTPTYNSSVSGNVIIAKRKKLKKESASSLSYEHLQLKLDDFRGTFATSEEFKLSFLNRLVNDAKESLSSNTGLFHSFGANKKLSHVFNNTEIPEDLRKTVVQFFSSTGLQSYHHLEIEYTEEKDTYAYLLHSIGRPSKKISGFTLYQNAEWPPSCVKLEVSSDGIIPSGIVLIYFVPLYTRVLCISIMATGRDRTYSFKGIKWSNINLGKFFLNYNELELKRVDSEIKNLAASFNNYYSKAIEQRIKYLERERAAQ